MQLDGMEECVQSVMLLCLYSNLLFNNIIDRFIHIFFALVKKTSLQILLLKYFILDGFMVPTKTLALVKSPGRLGP